ncbi:MAG: hypothetical protein IKV61_03975 [Clostridia bacterium]|nr:hypothetical protein [Clostridia bacterium]
MIIPEAIDYVNTLYYKSIDVQTLSEGVEILQDILTNKQPRANFKKNAEALLYRLTAKILALKYFDEGYLEEDYIILKQQIAEFIVKVEQEGYLKTVTLLKNLLEVAESVHSVMDGLDAEICRMQDENGNPTTSDQIEIEKFAIYFRSKAEALSNVKDTATLFGENVAMKDIKACAIKDVLDVAIWAENILKASTSMEKEKFFNENLQLLEEQDGLKIFKYYPPILEKEKNASKVTVIMSPFIDEVILYARAYEKERGISFSIINASAFIGKADSFIKEVFDSLGEKNSNIIITGIHFYNYQNKSALVENVLYYSKQFGEVFLIDEYGDRSIYDFAYDIIKQKEDLSYSDISYRYLTMPNYNFVVSEMEEIGMINASEYAYIKNKMAFMGYVGLNVAYSLFMQERQWKDDVIDISRRHEAECQTYLRRIPSQQQFIDVGWKHLELSYNARSRKENFDYDSIKDVNINNIKKILSSSSTLFAKCGLIVKYCVLAGDDVSSWERVEKGVKEGRINNATKLVAHLLDCENEPEVKIISLDEWESKGAGALCCDGGKRILYREDCCNDVAWLMDAICHECYHSFQHTLQHRGWQKWHWMELGVTEYRVPEWDYNFGKYKSAGSQAYAIQVVESDARTFANDCLMQGEESWQTVDWE